MSELSDLTKQYSDFKSKRLVFEDAYYFLQKPARDISKKDLSIARNILKEMEEWEIGYGRKEYSVLKNNSVLVAYLAYKFGVSIGLKKHELSDVYIAGLTQNIGKLYMCDDDKRKSYSYFASPLKAKDSGFEEISEAFKRYPSATKQYLEDNTNLNYRIIDTAVNYHSVYSHLFKEGYPDTKLDISQMDIALWFAESLSAVSFSNIPELQKNYSKGKAVSILKGFEILREETEEKIPLFWSKASGTLLTGAMLSMALSGAFPSRAKAANYTSDEVIALVNEYREGEGLSELDTDDKLMKAAMDKAKDMLEKGYWDHFGPNGETPWQFIKGEGYQYSVAGENLAKGFNDENKMMNAWLNSPAHKANIAKAEYTDIGVAVIDGELEGKNVTLVVQVFGKEEPQEQVQGAIASGEESSTPENNIEKSLKNFLQQIIARLKGTN